jgi:hypothetical protein
MSRAALDFPTPPPGRAQLTQRRRHGPPSGVGRPSRPVRVRLWLPLTPVWIVLAPFALLLAPLLTLAPQARGVNPFRAAFAIGHALLAMTGTVIEVEAPGALVKIRIF